MKNKVSTLAREGILTSNPTLKLVLGTCPTLALTTAAMNGIGMGAAVIFVLVCSNAFISLLRNVIPDRVRIPTFVLIIATLVTIVRMVMDKFLPSIYDALGIYLPLIVVNCIILGRAEAFASKNGVLDSALDGLGIGLGFTLSLTLLGAVRELLGAGAIFGHKLIAGDGMLVFILAPGAFIALAYLMTIFNKLTAKHKQG